MENAVIISWKGEPVGKVTNIMNDMWYIDADWIPYESDHSLEFVVKASKLKAEEIIKTPQNGMVASLKYDDSFSETCKVLVLSIDTSKIFMRSISDETAAYIDLNLLEPWRSTNTPDFYEKELKREISFFHPLHGKKVKAIGIRSDCDDVLFEVSNGSAQYAVVHLTFAKERSKEFPITHFYKDWKEVYEKRWWKTTKNG